MVLDDSCTHCFHIHNYTGCHSHNLKNYHSLVSDYSSDYFHSLDGMYSGTHNVCENCYSHIPDLLKYVPHYDYSYSCYHLNSYILNYTRKIPPLSMRFSIHLNLLYANPVICLRHISFIKRKRGTFTCDSKKYLLPYLMYCLLTNIVSDFAEDW